MVAIALPLMGADLDLGRQTVTWVVSAYTLTFGGLMLLGGRLADLIGPRRLVLTGMDVFTVASLATGAAQDAITVLAGRVGQGLGAAMLSPAALSVVVRMFEGEERNRALGIWSALGGGSAAVGVLVGGVLAAGPGSRRALNFDSPDSASRSRYIRTALSRNSSSYFLGADTVLTLLG